MKFAEKYCDKLLTFDQDFKLLKQFSKIEIEIIDCPWLSLNLSWANSNSWNPEEVCSRHGILYPPTTTITWLLPFRVKVTRKRSLTPWRYLKPTFWPQKVGFKRKKHPKLERLSHKNSPLSGSDPAFLPSLNWPHL